MYLNVWIIIFVGVCDTYTNIAVDIDIWIDPPTPSIYLITYKYTISLYYSVM